jgi:hypothetical protein
VDAILERIEREAGVPGLASILAENLTPTDLQSLLLEVYRRRAGQLTPRAVLAAYEANRFVRPSAVPPRDLLRWEQTAFAQLPPMFEALALSPVCPLGACSVAASVDQNWAVATARNTEVASDSTNVLALECAVRRRELLRSGPGCAAEVHLAASHRLLRAQRYDSPLSVSHFSCFALCSAGKGRASQQFELSALGLHIRIYLKALRAFCGAGMPLRVAVTDFSKVVGNDALETALLAPLRSEYDNTECAIDEARSAGRGYYVGLCFHLYATTAAGRRMELADGGSVDWTQKYLSNAKERMIISGLGSERLCQEFGGGAGT